MLQHSLDYWLEFIDKLDINHIQLGLERVTAVYQQCLTARCNNNQNTNIPKIVSVAGTNGKGSCVAVLEQLLLNANLRVSAYTSPHLIEFNERIRINGINVSNEVLCAAFEEVEQSRVAADIKLTYFEYGTLAAFMIMFDADLDVWILEVGLGGRLDAVNCIDPDIAIITSIGLDHTQILGDTLAQIAYEKAGISRPQARVICGTDRPELMTTLNADYQVEPLVWKRDFDCSFETDFIVDSNAACALQAAELLAVDTDYSADQWHYILQHLNLIGRLQKVQYEGLNLLLDVAHNADAARRLQQYLKVQGYRHITIALGMMVDKDILAVVDALRDVADQWWLCDIDNRQRSATALQIKSLLKPKYPDLNVQIATNVAAVIEQYRVQLRTLNNTSEINLIDESILVITGSFYITGAAYQWLLNND